MTMDLKIGISGGLDISSPNFPILLREFATFVQFRELNDRTRRVLQKLNGLVALSPDIASRYSFHLAIDKLYRRKKLGLKITIDDIETYNAMSFIAGALVAASQMGDKARDKFRSKILGDLRVDRDFRAIEHEIRCFVHFRQNNFAIRFADYEMLGQYDFLASRHDEQFEIECKFVSPDIGYPIKIDQSVATFEAILRKASKAPAGRLPAGIYLIRMSKYDQPSFSSVPDLLFEFVRQLDGATPSQIQFENLEISYDPRREWKTAARELENGQYLEFLAEHERSNSQAVMTNINGDPCMFCLVAEARPRIIRRIIDRVKDAAEQLSKNRAGLIWAHLEGLKENEFRLLAQHAKERNDAPFNIISHYILRSESRSHVAAIWYSASAGSYAESINARGEREMRSSGPVFQARSLKSKFCLPNDIAFRTI